MLLSDGERREVPVVPRRGLRPGERLPGPLIVEQADTTIWVAPGWSLQALEGDALSLTIHED